MNDIEKYQFDLNGYILVKGILDATTVARCLAATDKLEDRVASTIDSEPHFIGHYGLRYHYDTELGFSSYLSDHSGAGPQYVADDFLNADPAFDVLLDHAPTMKYVRELAMDPVRLSSSELRYRHKSNITGTHMGGPIDSRNQYQFIGRPIIDSRTGERQMRDFNLLAVRVLYALHEVPMENGPLCVVPGSHKANFHSPYGQDGMKEPGMIGLPMEAGDALFFTENLRHGGFPNLLNRPRKTIHLSFGPAWHPSQSPAHWNDVVHVTEAAWARYSEAQRALLPPPGPAMAGEPLGAGSARQSIDRLRNEVKVLHEKVGQLESELKVARRGSVGAVAADLSRRLLGRRE